MSHLRSLLCYMYIIILLFVCLPVEYFFSLWFDVVSFCEIKTKYSNMPNNTDGTIDSDSDILFDITHGNL